MKKVISLLLIVFLCGMLSVPALAATEKPVITMQPQSPYYPKYSVATYTVKATGKNLTATWYIEYEGKTYNTSKLGEGSQPWEPYAGEAYGPKKLDNNTFCFVFEGIEEELSGSKIWCEIEDGHYNIVSRAGYITVGDYGSPPEILNVPAAVTVKKGKEADIRCLTKSSDGSQLEFLWYETSTGKFEDMRAIDRGAETGDYMFCDTSAVGTRYYICGITTSNGGMAYSSIVKVTVEAEKKAAAAPKIETKTLPDAVVGAQYSQQLKCSDPNAEFSPYYNPGTQNDLEEGSWLGLSIDGWLMGTPAKAGTYSFSVCAMGEGGEDYEVYTLTVKEADSTETAKPNSQTESSAPANPDTKTNQSEKTLPWWVLALVGLGAAGVGVVVAVILIKKK